MASNKQPKEKGIYGENIDSYSALERHLGYLPQNSSLHVCAETIKKGISQLPSDIRTNKSQAESFARRISPTMPLETQYLDDTIALSEKKINQYDAEIVILRSDIKEKSAKKASKPKLAALRTASGTTSFLKWGVILIGGGLSYGLGVAFIPYPFVPVILAVSIIVSAYCIGSIIQAVFNRYHAKGRKKNRCIDKEISTQQTRIETLKENKEKLSTYQVILRKLACCIKKEHTKAPRNAKSLKIPKALFSPKKMIQLSGKPKLPIKNKPASPFELRAS